VVDLLQYQETDFRERLKHLTVIQRLNAKLQDNNRMIVRLESKVESFEEGMENHPDTEDKLGKRMAVM